MRICDWQRAGAANDRNVINKFTHKELDIVPVRSTPYYSESVGALIEAFQCVLLLGILFVCNGRKASTNITTILRIVAYNMKPSATV
jgi:hypothetical protein